MTSDAKVRRLLLIDDSELSLEFAAIILGSAGYQVRTATDVACLGELVADWSPDLILTDVRMPGMSGVELCHAFKTWPETSGVPVVLLSSLSRDKLAILAAECAADGYLSKMDGLDGLAEEIDSLWPTLVS